MLGYVIIGTDDLEKSKRFYDAILAPLGGEVLFVSQRAVTYSSGGEAMLSISLPYNKQPCTFGNGSMFSLTASSQALVDKVHEIAMTHGAQDEGAPGNRTPEMYIAYFRDPFGNKLAVYHIESVAVYVKGAIEIVKARAAAQS